MKGVIMAKRIMMLVTLSLIGCILFGGCAGQAAGDNIPGSAGNGENIHIPSDTGSGNQEKDGAGQDIPHSAAAGKPDGTAHVPEVEGDASGAGSAGSGQEDKSPRLQVEEKKLHLDMYSKIRRVGEDRLLVYGNKEILLLDMYTLEILKRADNEAYGNKFSLDTVCQREDGSYIMGGMLHDEGGTGKKSATVLITYDTELQAGSVMDLKETLCPDYESGIYDYEFLDGGQKLLYFLTRNQKSNFYLFDFQKGEVIEIVPQREVYAGNFLYLESVDQILAVGIGEGHQRALIRLDMDGQILDQNSEHSYGKVWGFQDFVLINEAVSVGKKGEGAFFCYDIGDGSVRSFPRVDNNGDEVRAVTSGGGKYFVAIHQFPDKQIPYILHIYSSEDGRLMHEMQLSSEEFGEGVILGGIYIDDETGRVILYGTWAGRSLETWIVSKDLVGESQAVK